VALDAAAAAKENACTSGSIAKGRHLERSGIQRSYEVSHGLELILRERKSRHAAAAVLDNICNLIFAAASKPAIVS
jgi:hypothetical protein